MPCASPRFVVGVQGRALADAEQEPDGEQAGEAADEPGAEGRHDPDRPADQQRDARAKAVRDPAADDLKKRVGIREGREGDPEQGVGEAELGLDR
jgi:hypothetical protein